jgi:hypothetical protein
MKRADKKRLLFGYLVLSMIMSSFCFTCEPNPAPAANDDAHLGDTLVRVCFWWGHSGATQPELITATLGL